MKTFLSTNETYTIQNDITLQYKTSATLSRVLTAIPRRSRKIQKAQVDKVSPDKQTDPRPIPHLCDYGYNECRRCAYQLEKADDLKRDVKIGVKTPHKQNETPVSAV